MGKVVIAPMGKSKTNLIHVGERIDISNGNIRWSGLVEIRDGLIAEPELLRALSKRRACSLTFEKVAASTLSSSARVLSTDDSAPEKT